MNAWLLALAIGVGGGAAVWLILARDLLRVVVGLALAGTAVNLFVLMAGRVGSGVPATWPTPSGARRAAPIRCPRRWCSPPS
jgi:multisubunit Na+/H+ antiporter MnhC subunit